jgi:hypothetical protein
MMGNIPLRAHGRFAHHPTKAFNAAQGRLTPWLCVKVYLYAMPPADNDGFRIFVGDQSIGESGAFRAAFFLRCMTRTAYSGSVLPDLPPIFYCSARLHALIS